MKASWWQGIEVQAVLGASETIDGRFQGHQTGGIVKWSVCVTHLCHQELAKDWVHSEFLPN